MRSALYRRGGRLRGLLASNDSNQVAGKRLVPFLLAGGVMQLGRMQSLGSPCRRRAVALLSCCVPIDAQLAARREPTRPSRGALTHPSRG